MEVKFYTVKNATLYLFTSKWAQMLQSIIVGAKYSCSQFTIFVKMGVLVLHFVSASVRQ